MRLPLLLWFAVRLQDATNWLFMRSFTVELGILKHKGLAVVLTISRVFGSSQKLLMDIHSFLDIAEILVESDDRVFESKGFTIDKKHKMEEAFTIPSWAFPKAYYEMLLCGQHIAKALKHSKESLERVSDFMKELGVPAEEIEKIRQGITKAPAVKEKASAEEQQENK